MEDVVRCTVAVVAPNCQGGKRAQQEANSVHAKWAHARVLRLLCRSTPRSSHAQNISAAYAMRRIERTVRDAQ